MKIWSYHWIRIGLETEEDIGQDQVWQGVLGFYKWNRYWRFTGGSRSRYGILMKGKQWIFIEKTLKSQMFIFTKSGSE